MREIGPVRAVLFNLLGFGLGYLYVGQIRLAFALIAGVVGLLAVAGWSRLVFEPLGVYGLGILAAGIALFVMIHCGLIAVRNRSVVAHVYNRWWFYALWVVGSFFFSEGVFWSRPVLFGFEPFRIPSSSMAPTIQRGDYIMTDTWYFDRADPQHGDLAAFRVPGDVGVKYLMRVVGLPGDRIEIRDDMLIRNGAAIDEPYVQLAGGGVGSLSNFGPVIVPAGSYFVPGDNRHNARDSRFTGSVERALLHGRVVHRWIAYDESIRWERFPQRIESAGR